MKKFFLFIFTIILLIPVCAFIMWFFQSKKFINIMIIDKSSIVPQKPLHESFVWILNNRNYRKYNDKLYDENCDYFGFIALETYKKKRYAIRDFEKYTYQQIDSISKKYDFLYYIDARGVSFNEWFLDSIPNNNQIYGGISENEFQLINNFNKNDKLVILEHDVLNFPTSISVKNNIENLFRIKYSGWKAKYFDTLDTLYNSEINHSILSLYKIKYGNWNFKKSGIIFLKNYEDIIVLEKDKHLEISIPIIKSTIYGKNNYQLASKTYYSKWIEIIESVDSGNKILADYKIIAYQNGYELLRKHNIPMTFPAIIECKKNGTMFYFAGDFSKNSMLFATCYFKEITDFDFLIMNEKISLQQKFFTSVYYPLITTILQNYYNLKIAIR